MEALNASSLTPVSVLSDLRTEPKKLTSSFSPLKFSKSNTNRGNILSKSFKGSIAILSSVLSNGFARALTYEEALEQAGGGASTSGDGGSELDIGGVLDGVVTFGTGVLDGVVAFGTENPLVIFGGVTLLAVPLIFNVFKEPKAFGVDSAKNAYAKLGEDRSAQLLDIRAPADIRGVGSPDIRGLKKKVVSIAYKGEDKPGFLKKLALKFKEPANTTLFILDKFDGSSELVAELVTVNGFKAAYAIKDGAEGPRGWQNSGLPWISPKKSLSFDFGSLADSLGGAVEEGSEVLPLTLALVAATGLGLLAFTEIETVLQIFGSAALVQFVSKKLLFAEDRKATLKLIDEFVTTNIAPKEFVGDVQEIGKAFLPVTFDNKTLPEPASVLKAEAVPDPSPSSETEAASTPQINSVPNAEVKEDSLPKPPRPLSPFASYPDFKPPASPSPSPP